MNVNVVMKEVKIAYQIWLDNIDRIYHVENLLMMKLVFQEIGCKHVHLNGLMM
jgi:hypothetical protein